ncbi:YqgE/AlgH family protein [Rapidithrix thailandica]|uniref:UPF0301 protein AAG747_02530 n=1 Tax=Rapidithrix thailandica TaxID=413964 RepID=A0AAW9RT34_9BACT
MHLFDFDFSHNDSVTRGNLLVAEPFLNDPNFCRSVIIMCEHQHEMGSFGLVLNRPTKITIEEVTDNFFLESQLFIGGPVEQNTLHYIHRFGELENAIPLKDGLFWGGDYEQLKAMNLNGELHPENCRFFMGYSGWGEEQLQSELEQHSWIVSDVDLSWVFSQDPKDLWSNVLKRMGGRFKVYSNYPTDPRLN